MKYHVVADALTVLGFSLAGVHGTVVTNEEDTREAFDSALEDPEVGILIITERHADLIRPQVDELVFSRQFPLVLEIPDAEGPMEGKPTLRQMVHRAIGISV